MTFIFKLSELKLDYLTLFSIFTIFINVYLSLLLLIFYISQYNFETLYISSVILFCHIYLKYFKEELN